MATLNIAVQDGNNINVEVVPTPRQTISIDRGVAGVGIESVAIVYVDPDYFLEFTYTNGTTELVQLPSTAAGVVSFNTRIGAVTLNSSDVTTALGYTPPTPTGTGASGTWSISINGNAATATNVPYTGLTGTVPTWNQNTTGNAATVTNGVYTTDTGTVTNAMLAGSIANNKLTNSAITINGTSTSLGGSVSVGTVTAVSGTTPIASTGGTTPAISISQSGTSTDGYLSSTDWNTFNSKTSNTGTVTSVAATAGTGISVSGSPITTSGTLTITNTAPDQVVSLTGAGTTAVTGTYPNFTITSDDQFDGTVTSVSGTGSVNGISLSGTVTSNGNLTLGGTLSNVSLSTQVTGTLPIANGGTNATTASGARTSLGLGTSAVLDAAVALGTATLDAGGTVPLSQIPASIQGGLNYQGTWNASTNTPTLVSSVGSKGYYYAVSVAGSTNLNGITDWNIGDLAVYDGTAWQKIDNTDAVTSVNGYTGSVVLTTTDVAEGTNQYFTTARARTSVSAGTGITYDNVTGVITNASPSLGGDVVGAASSTDNAITRFNGTTGKLIQNSSVIIDDSNNVTGVNSLTATTLVVNDNATLGGSNTDSLAVNARITTDLDPDANNAKDIGTNGRNWRDGFFGRTLHTVNLDLTGTASFDGAQGTSGQVLTSAGTGNTPTWTTPTTGTVTSVAATAGTGISVSGSPITSSGTLTITNTAPDQVVSLTASTGISTSGTYPNFTITNTAPDQTVSLTGAGTSVVTGTYPNFTITSNDSATGTVTSVAATVPSFLSVTGSPVTTSGTLAISYSGTALPVANGGTGLTAPGTSGNVLTSNGTSWTSAPPTGGGGSSGFEQTFLLMGA